MKQLSSRTWFLITGGILLVLQSLDGWITTAVVTAGIGREMNPFLTDVVDNSWFWAVKVLITLGVLGILYWRSHGRDRYYRRATKVLAGLGIFYTLVVAWNSYCLFVGTVVWASL